MGEQYARYEQKNFHYDVLEQALEDLKFERDSMHGWNRLVTDLNGVSMNKIGDDHIRLTYHKIENGTIDLINQYDDVSKKFLNEIVKDLKKRYKKLCKKTLKLKKVKEDKDVDKISRMYAESSPLYSDVRYGGAMGKFYMKFHCIYKVS